MASSSSAGPSTAGGSWADFEEVYRSVNLHTVDRLKAIISSLNSGCGFNLPKSGRKQDLIDRIKSQLSGMKERNQLDRYQSARIVLKQFDSGRHVSSSYTVTPSYGTAVPPLMPNHPSLPARPQPSYHSAVVAPQPQQPAWPSRAALQTPAAPPIGAGPPVAAVSHAPPKPGIKFKLSPYFRIEAAVSDIHAIAETHTPTERSSTHFSFSLNDDQRAKLSSQSPTQPKYQLRLFCTSSAFYTPPTAWAPANPNVTYPIEFPSTCDIRINGIALLENYRGLKKKPGTAPPLFMKKDVHYKMTGMNKVEFVHINGTMPFVSKRFFLVVNLVQVTTSDELVGKLRRGRLRSAADVKSGMLKMSTEDDDIVAGAQKLSLKCPLAYTRIITPARSAQCVHSQCFDALNWYTMMEQTTTWTCPVCEKVLAVEDMIVDGYFAEILKATPDSVDDVVVEPNAEWHTSDGKYASAGWEKPKPTIKPAANPKPKTESAPAPKLKKEEARDVLCIDDSDDDDSDDETYIKNELANTSLGASAPVANGGKGKGRQSDVIDLTLSSDDEDDPPPPPRPKAPSLNSEKSQGKRKAMDDDDYTDHLGGGGGGGPAAKRTRVDTPSEMLDDYNTALSMAYASANSARGLVNGAYEHATNGYANGAAAYYQPGSEPVLHTFILPKTEQVAHHAETHPPYPPHLQTHVANHRQQQLQRPLQQQQRHPSPQHQHLRQQSPPPPYAIASTSAPYPMPINSDVNLHFYKLGHYYSPYPTPPPAGPSSSSSSYVVDPRYHYQQQQQQFAHPRRYPSYPYGPHFHYPPSQINPPQLPQRHYSSSSFPLQHPYATDPAGSHHVYYPNSLPPPPDPRYSR